MIWRSGKDYDNMRDCSQVRHKKIKSSFKIKSYKVEFLIIIAPFKFTKSNFQQLSFLLSSQKERLIFQLG